MHEINKIESSGSYDLLKKGKKEYDFRSVVTDFRTSVCGEGNEGGIFLSCQLVVIIDIINTGRLVLSLLDNER